MTEIEQNIFDLQGELPACDKEREEAEGTWCAGAGGVSKGWVWLAESLSTMINKKEIWNNILSSSSQIFNLIYPSCPSRYIFLHWEMDILFWGFFSFQFMYSYEVAYNTDREY